MTLGEELKRAREEKGLTLSDAAEKTRISRSFLQALEDGEYSVIPGEVFVSGFLRSYARELGLDEKDVLARYKEAAGLPPTQPESGTAAPEPAQTVIGALAPSSRLSLRTIASALVLVVIVACGLALLVWNTGEEPVAPPPVEPVRPAVMDIITTTPPATTESPEMLGYTTVAPPVPGAEPQPAPATTPAPAGPVPAKPTVPAQAKDAAAPRPAEPARGLTLKLTAKEDTWYSYTSDDKAKGDVLLKRGEVGYIRAGKKILLNLGNAGGVTAELNGKKLGPLGPAKTVKRGLVFTTDDQPSGQKTQ